MIVKNWSKQESSVDAEFEEQESSMGEKGITSQITF